LQQCEKCGAWIEANKESPQRRAFYAACLEFAALDVNIQDVPLGMREHEQRIRAQKPIRSRLRDAYRAMVESERGEGKQDHPNVWPGGSLVNPDLDEKP